MAEARAQRPSNPVLIELHCAAAAFTTRRSQKDEAARVRLRRAVLAVMRELGAEMPATLVADQAEALEALRRLIQRCSELRCSWPEIVAIVNRETEAS